MTKRKLQAITFVGAFALVFSLQSRAAEPLQLSESQLDEVTAGFLAVTMTAEAIALSQVADTFTNTLTVTDVTVGQPQPDGYIYSTGEGLALATAIGERVYTSTSGGFETDEQVVSLQVNHSVTTETVKQAPKSSQRHGGKRGDQRAKERVASRDGQSRRGAKPQEKRTDDRAATQAKNNKQKSNPDKHAGRQAAKPKAKTDKQATRGAEGRKGAKHQTRQEQRAAKKQPKKESHARTERRKGGAPVIQQTQVLQLQVVTRRPATDLPL